MAYFLIQDFSSGLDVRKSPYTSANGSLQQLDDGHITRGGEIEKRKALELTGDLLRTYALVSGKITGQTQASDIVFGDAASPPPGLPAGVEYQRLQHPDGTHSLTGITDYTLYDGRPFVAAEFSDGSQWIFYDGQLVTDFGAGVVRASMTTNDAIAEYLKGLIDASPNFSATRTGTTVFVTGLVGVDYAVATETANGGATNNQALSVNELLSPVAAVAGQPAIAEFAIMVGENGASNYIDQVRVDVGGVFTDLISSPVLFNTTPELTALDVVNAINAGSGTHNYTASTKYGKVFVYAQTSLGASANGRIIEVTAKGAICLYNGSFSITAGTSGTGNELISVKVNGLEVTSAPVAWATSNSATAAAVAANIRAYSSSPKINAVALGNTVYLSPEKIRSNDPVTLSVQVTGAGDVGSGTGAPTPVENQYPDYGTTDPRNPGQALP